MDKQLFLGVDPYIEHELFDEIAPHVKEQFKIYHQQNPHIYELFLKYARDLVRANRKHYSSRIIIERIRWHLNVETIGDEFKINNNYCSCYGRLSAAQYPNEFGSLFEFRRTPGVKYGS